MTDKLIEQIKADREAGTPGPWHMNGWGIYADALENPEINGTGIVCSVATGVENTWEAVANTNRIARVPEYESRILADAEVIKAAEALVSRLNKLQTYFDLTAEEFDNLTHDEQADTIRQHRLITETIEAFNHARQGRKGCGPDDKE